MSQVYRINKNMGRPIQFKGLKAQYIWWLGGGLVSLLIFFAVLYLLGVNAYLCLLIVSFLGTGLFIKVYHSSKRYGEHGMMKKAAYRAAPYVLKSRSRKLFMQWKKN